MKKFETSKLKRYKRLFMISVVGFILTPLFYFSSGIIFQDVLAKEELMFWMGAITGTFLSGIFSLLKEY